MTWAKEGLNTPLQLIGFAMEDDAIQIDQDNPSLTYTKGLYGGTSANISQNTMGTVTLKFKSSSEDNKRFAAWHNEMMSGNAVPADIVVTGVDFKDSALKCLPEKIPAMPRTAAEDPSITWILKASEVIIGEPITAAVAS